MAIGKTASNSKTAETKDERKLGLGLLVALGAGSMIGSGILTILPI